MPERSRIDDDRRILEAVPDKNWTVLDDQRDCGWISEWDMGYDGETPVENVRFAANARNRMHLYLALARAVRDAIDVPFNSPEWHAKARAIASALAAIEAPDVTTRAAAREPDMSGDQVVVHQALRGVDTSLEHLIGWLPCFQQKGAYGRYHSMKCPGAGA